MHTNPEQPTSEEKETTSRTAVIWMFIVALIGFGFAIYRSIQFYGVTEPLKMARLTRIELYIYRGLGPWAVIVVFLIMGLYGLYNAINGMRQLRPNSRKR